MRSINCPHPPRRYRKNSNNNETFDILAIVALGVSIYIATLGRKNLEYNRKSVAVNERIARELHQLNSSTVVKDLRDYLKKEEKQ